MQRNRALFELWANDNVLCDGYNRICSYVRVQMSRNSLVDAQEEEKDSRDLSEPVDEEVEVPIPGQHGHCEAQRHVDDAVCEPETEVDENGKLGKATSKVNEKNENLGVFKEDKKTNQTKKLMNVYLRRFLV